MRLGMTVAVAVIWCALGCEDEKSAMAPQQCEAFRERYCARVVDCVRPSDREAGLTACRSAFAASVDCGRSVGVKESYGRCLAEVDAAECAVISRSLPASCSGVILQPRQ